MVGPAQLCDQWTCMRCYRHRHDINIVVHQALKFDAAGQQLLAIGQRLQPGHDAAHLCKPTAVCVWPPILPRLDGHQCFLAPRVHLVSKPGSVPVPPVHAGRHQTMFYFCR